MSKPKAEDPLVKKFTEEHQQVVEVKHRGKVFIFRPLTLDEYEDFQAKVSKPGAAQGPINRECCQLALCHPSLEELTAAFEATPGFAAAVSTAITRIAFDGLEVEVKKA